MYIFETVFDIVYLISVISAGFYMLYKAERINAQFKLFGIMAVVLGVGDSFHLIPRIFSMWGGGFELHTESLGMGQFITSITMTVFYLILYFVWRKRYNVKGKKLLSVIMFVLGALRVLLCLMPQNDWLGANAPVEWGIYRNIPFAIMGIIVIVLFFKSAREHNDKGFKFMWLAITLSFAFYIPVVLFADTFPPIGSLMLPKTVAYVWIVWMGLSEMRKLLPSKKK